MTEYFDLSPLFRGISISMFLNNLAQFIYLISREIILYNWLDNLDAANFIIYFAVCQLFTTFIIFNPYILPNIYAEIGEKRVMIANRTLILILLPNYLIVIIILGFFLLTGINFNLNLDSGNFLFLFFISIIILIISLGSITESILYGLKKPMGVGISKITFALSFFIMLMISIFLNIINFYIAIIIFLGSNLTSLIYSFFYYKKQIRIIGSENINQYFDLSIAKRIIILGFPLFLSGIFRIFRFNIFPIFLGGISGNYSIYFHLSTTLVIYLVSLIELPIAQNIQPYFASFFKKGNISQIKMIYRYMISLIVVLIISIALLFYGLLPLFLKIVYSKYYSTELVYIFKITIIGCIFFSLNILYGKIILSKGKTYILLINQFLGAIIAVIFLYLTLITNEIIFSALGFSSSFAFICLSNCFISKKYIKLSLKEIKIIPILLTSFISIFIYELFLMLSQNIYLSSIISLICFFVFCFIFRIITINFLKNFLKILKNFLINANRKNLL